MSTPDPARYAAASIVSTSILAGRRSLTWLLRDEPTGPADSGWRFLSEDDDDVFLSDPANLTVVSFQRVTMIEPAIAQVYALPVGTDLHLVVEGARRRFFDNASGREVVVPRVVAAAS